MENIELTRSELTVVLRFGEIDNSELAISFFTEVKEECGLEIIAAYYSLNQLQCYFRNCGFQELDTVINDDMENRILSIFAKYAEEQNADADTVLAAFDFDNDARWNLIYRSMKVIKGYIEEDFNADTRIFAELGKSRIPVHNISFLSEREMNRFYNSNGLEKLRGRFSRYISARDYWNVFGGTTYSPNIGLIDELSERQRFVLEREGI